MDILYYAYVLTDDKEPFMFELRENPIKNISDDGTIETKYPCFYGCIKSSKFLNGSSDLKTDVEYSSGNSSVYFSMDYDKCMHFLANKREETYKKYRDILCEVNKFHEKFLDSCIQKHIEHGVKKYSLWNEGYAVTGEFATATYLGEFEGDSFNEACDNWAKTLDEESIKCYKPGTDEYRPSYWACRIFDNEIDARKSFG